MKTYRLLSIDETGKASLNHPSTLFTLSGVVIPESAKSKIDLQTRKLKKKYFNDEEIVFHTRDMLRGKGTFSSLSNQTKANSFWNEFMTIIDNPVISLIFIVSDKSKIKKLSWLPKTILRKSYLRMLESFCDHLKRTQSHGKIILESDPSQDLYLLQAHNILQAEGTSNKSVSGREYRNLVTSVSLVNKANLDVDIQIADALAPFAGMKYHRDILKINKTLSMTEQMKIDLIDKKLADSQNPSVFEVLI